MQPARLALTVLLACAASGCTSSEEAPWDGRYTPLEERGDWMDSGPLSICRVLEGTDTACGSLASFDLSGCKRRTMEALEREGVYRGELRFDARGTQAARAAPLGGGFKLSASGIPEQVLGATALAGVWDARTFLVSSQSPDGLFTFVGCNAVGPRSLTGCFSRCRDGVLVESGTFRTERVARFKGEHEVSGGMKLVSERWVDLGMPVDVQVIGKHAYVISQDHEGQRGGLTVFDVSEPEAPVRVARMSLPEDSDWRGATFKDGVLYIASASSGVVVLDISLPSAPVFVRGVPDPPVRVGMVSVDGDRLYAVATESSAGTLMFDISTPSEPRLLERIVSGARISETPSSRGPVSYEGRLYVNHLRDGLQVVDTRAGGGAKLLGRYTYPYANSRASAVGTFGGRIVAFESSLGAGARLRALDVSEPHHIVKIGEYGLRGVVSPRALELRGSRLYMTYHQEGLRVLDVSNPTQPREVAYFNSFRETDPGRGDALEEGATGLQVPGDGYVYVVDTSRGLLVLTEPPL
ncbi:LVIVD repeat-containing protein [Corallococcus terminator]